MAKDPLRAYLSKHAEPRAEEYADRVRQTYERALVVPMYDEPHNALQQVLVYHPHLVNPSTTAADTLIVAVINAPDNAEPNHLARTRSLLHELQQRNLKNLLCVDCASPGRTLPSRQGVGLARKLGTDIAAALFARGQLNGPWIYHTDADAVLPADYFAAPLPDVAAVVRGHQHFAEDPTLAQAARLYEMHMAYYHTSLAQLGSRYAFPTLGSTIIVQAPAYASVRGYPRRDAAEDFYLLNKLAKIGDVIFQPTPRVQLQARPSQRVPFGTGPTLIRIAKQLADNPSGNTFLSYHRDSFKLLADALDFLGDCAENSNANTRQEVITLLNELGFAKVRSNIDLKYTTAERRAMAYRDWFDAKRTLRFIHEARRYYPDQPLLQTLAALPPKRQQQIGFASVL